MGNQSKISFLAVLERKKTNARGDFGALKLV